MRVRYFPNTHAGWSIGKAITPMKPVAAGEPPVKASIERIAENCRGITAMAPFRG
jgi:hypothetical protein